MIATDSLKILFILSGIWSANLCLEQAKSSTTHATSRCQLEVRLNIHTLNFSAQSRWPRSQRYSALPLTEYHTKTLINGAARA